MIDGIPSAEELAEEVRRSLRLPRFPNRRDIEFAALARQGDGAVAACDMFWLGRETFVATVLSLPSTGLDAALAVVAARELLRAAVVRAGEPAGALAAWRRHAGDRDGSAGVMVLNVQSGQFRFAVAGEAGLALPQGSDDSGLLRSGQFAWLTIGVDVPAARPSDGLDAQLRAAVLGARHACAAAALQFKAPQKRQDVLTLLLQNDGAEVAGVLGELDRFRSAHGIDDASTRGVDVALDEVLTNAIDYAFRDGRNHEVQVEMSLTAGRLVIEVRDDGVPFDPLTVPKPDLDADIEHRQIGGLGMHIVRNVMDEVCYARREGWNVLRMEKAVSVAGAVK